MADEGFNVKKKGNILPSPKWEVSDREEPGGTVIAALTCMQWNRATFVILEIKFRKGKVILEVSNTCFKPEATTEVFELKNSSADNAKTCCRCRVQKWGRSFFSFKETWLLCCLWKKKEKDFAYCRLLMNFWIKISSSCYCSHKSYL